jgi:predicted HTH transcriptional regulator
MVETLKQGISRVRNRAIVRILRELHLIEILGSGYERISTTFEQGYPEPDWRKLGVVVRVAIPTTPSSMRVIVRVPPRRWIRLARGRNQGVG